MKTEEKNLCFQTKMDRWVGPYFILLYLPILNTLEVCFFIYLKIFHQNLFSEFLV